jgi:hypothetical protein
VLTNCGLPQLSSQVFLRVTSPGIYALWEILGDSAQPNYWAKLADLGGLSLLAG